jgi:hypothetical protein
MKATIKNTTKSKSKPETKPITKPVIKKYKKARYIAGAVILAVFILGRRNVSNKQAEYYRKIYDMVNDEYVVYGQIEGRNVAVYDKYNNKIRLAKINDYTGRYRFSGFYRRENCFVFEITDNSGVIFTNGDKINIEKYKTLKYLGEDEYYYRTK